MRKLFFILLALAGCLLFSESRGDVRAVGAARTAVLSVGNAPADQWQCERICNSDLNQPRVLREAEASPAAPMFQRGSLHTAARAALRCVALCGGTGVAKLISTYQSNDLSVGPHAVDYYVYRLRRLII
ncbi:hypothetical protein SAMN05444145_11154 [Alistipes timonensis JC136]|uniref:Uncharacterized protein n=1 Tax=Alistipes timonensis JC136 TaxID=1033731 RepID=A0A1H4FNP1_9BACT|nr:hypothetical protein [Alistipes timonensis]SEA98298.1 hypothetical protein SAMN05444145_11154 [Alistipes timonensis JC136]